jgi:hypothetical protein
VVANVLQEQLNAWYDNLAPGLKFPLGPVPVLDPHKAFLKGQYYCILVIANWSFVVRLITNEPMDENRRAYITKHGIKCMESIYLFVLAVERMMMFRQVMLFANFYGYVAIPWCLPSTCQLILVVCTVLYWGCLLHIMFLSFTIFRYLASKSQLLGVTMP